MKIVQYILIIVLIIISGCKKDKDDKKAEHNFQELQISDNSQAALLILKYRPYHGEDLYRIANPRQGLTYIKKEDLQTLKSLTLLTCLNLRFLQIEDAKLAFLKDLPHLLKLHLGQKTSDVGLVHLKVLDNLRELYLDNNVKIRDAGLVHIKSLVNLRKLSLAGTRVSDKGLVHLKSLTNLDWLNLYHTSVTGVGAKKLQLALSKCKIHIEKKKNN